MTRDRSSTIGTPHQQALLDATVELYRQDPRAQAVLVFGSLARGDWHRYSDIDLDVVLDGDVDTEVELGRLAAAFAALGDRVLLIDRHTDSGDLVLASLGQLSVRFHALPGTSPNIIADMRVLWSRIDPALIRAAGAANRRSPEVAPVRLIDRCLRYAVEIDIACRRESFWMAVELLHRVRGHLIEMYAAARDEPRPLKAWHTADGELQALLRAMLPSADLQSIRACRDAVLDMLEHHLAKLSGGTLELSADQRTLLAALRHRIDPRRPGTCASGCGRKKREG